MYQNKVKRKIVKKKIVNLDVKNSLFKQVTRIIWICFINWDSIRDGFYG